MLEKRKGVERSTTPRGVIFGSYNKNSKLNFIVYDFEFSNDQAKEYAANEIVENALTRVDSEGFSLTL